MPAQASPSSPAPKNVDPATAQALAAQDPQQVSQVSSHLEDEIERLTKQREEEEKLQRASLEQKVTVAADTPPLPDLNALIANQLTPPTGSGPVSSRQKERKLDQISHGSPEKAPMREIQVEFEPPPEVEQWVKPKPDPQTISLPQPIKDEYGEVLLQATQIPKPKIVLPMNQQQINKALHHRVKDSVRWLAEWCVRTIRLYPGRVFYRKPAN